jgi:predicted ribosome quality control (RQC) complex YloA/Tae2 family protein
LHAKGCSGSHCVVKGENNDGKLPAPILTKAAEIAAYYSDAKKSSYTPVVYTQKKYVRKPKGAKQGAVILQKETTIMVTPTPPPSPTIEEDK